jgi:hypothetical protein
MQLRYRLLKLVVQAICYGTWDLTLEGYDALLVAKAGVLKEHRSVLDYREDPRTSFFGYYRNTFGAASRNVGVPRPLPINASFQTRRDPVTGEVIRCVYFCDHVSS